ncbi:hypothetical protein J4Q44_G00059330 [Coregonus suidteri]|uniref:Uncharacterized protein n=1 Tax=Coregonus suidteri TaxID=861788 RepID=A0AAN8M658_9TELE
MGHLHKAPYRCLLCPADFIIWFRLGRLCERDKNAQLRFQTVTHTPTHLHRNTHLGFHASMLPNSPVPKEGRERQSMNVIGFNVAVSLCYYPFFPYELAPR